MSALHPITITDQDVSRLMEVVSLYSDVDEQATEALQRELDRAVVVPPSAVAASVVTMNSHVVCRDDQGTTREVVIVYPQDADANTGRVSVLAPLAQALLGARVGDRVELRGRGRSRMWSIEEIRYQPEAAGDFHL
jgi:regulator of nucleoside diphosphate kinase